jgi:uncharacterized protein
MLIKLNINSNGRKISTSLIRPDKIHSPLPALIFIHGWKSNKEGNDKRSMIISEQGFICLTLDLGGHGESEGSTGDFSREDHLDDIKTAYDYLTKLPEVDTEKIGVIGSSYGGYLAAASTNFLKYRWLILRVPALYFDDRFDVPTEKLINEDETGEAFKSSNLTPEKSLALKGASKFPGEILIIESEKDSVIPHSVIENYLKFMDDSKLTYKIMKGAGHSLETEVQENEYVNILLSFLKENK